MKEKENNLVVVQNQLKETKKKNEELETKIVNLNQRNKELESLNVNIKKEISSSKNENGKLLNELNKYKEEIEKQKNVINDKNINLNNEITSLKNELPQKFYSINYLEIMKYKSKVCKNNYELIKNIQNIDELFGSLQSYYEQLSAIEMILGDIELEKDDNMKNNFISVSNKDIKKKKKSKKNLKLKKKLRKM